MHGRAKLDRPPTESEIEADRIKSSTYQKLVDILTLKKINKEYSFETLELTGKFLIKNPDYYSLWNLRREILLEQYSSIGLKRIYNLNELISKDISENITKKELELSSQAILKNSKSYGAWFHRIWILQRFEVNIDNEIELCNQFLDADQRNFHCWNYRRYLIQTFNISSEIEYNYTTTKLSENFSNYSSYHHRSIFLPRYISSTIQTFDDLQTILENEFQIIENAIFTEPDDQSAWWYYMFIFQYLHQILLNSKKQISHNNDDNNKVVNVDDVILNEGNENKTNNNNNNNNINNNTNINSNNSHAITKNVSSTLNSVPIPSLSPSDWNKFIIFLFDSYEKQYKGLQELSSIEQSCKWILIGLLTLTQSIEGIFLNSNSNNNDNDNNNYNNVELLSRKESWNTNERNEEYNEYLNRLYILDENRRRCYQYKYEKH